MLIRLTFVFTAFFLTFFPLRSEAFLPTFNTVRQELAEEYENLTRWQVDMQFKDLPVFTIRLWQNDRKWRQEWIRQILTRDEDGKLLFAAVGHGSTLEASFPEVEHFPTSMFFYWKPADTLWWSRMGIDTSIRSLQFFEDRPCLVIGAQYGQYRNPQLWLDHERYLPLRLRTGEWEVQWAQYKKIGNFWLPQEMEVIFPSADPYVLNLKWRSVETSMPQSLFSPQTFEQTYAQYRGVKYIPGPLRPFFQQFPQATAQ